MNTTKSKNVHESERPVRLKTYECPKKYNFSLSAQKLTIPNITAMQTNRWLNQPHVDVSFNIVIETASILLSYMDSKTQTHRLCKYHLSSPQINMNAYLLLLAIYYTHSMFEEESFISEVFSKMFHIPTDVFYFDTVKFIEQVFSMNAVLDTPDFRRVHGIHKNAYLILYPFNPK